MDSNLVLEAQSHLRPMARCVAVPEAPRDRASSAWTALWRDLSLCWCDPDAPEDVAAGYRVRQFQALLQQMPLGGFNCVVFSMLIVVLFWRDASQDMLLAWLAAVWATSGAGLVAWYRYRAVSSFPSVTRLARVLTAIVTLNALLFALMPAALFGVTDLGGKLFLISIAAAFVAHGALQCARWPWAGCMWGLGMCFGGSAAMHFLYGDTYGYIVGLCACYGFVIATSVLLSSRQFVRNLMAETEIDRQKQLISLLLDDFEANASDWLWETDPDGLMRHASGRLAEAIGVSASSLFGRSMTEILVDAASMPDADQQSAIGYLEHCFRCAIPFRNVEVMIASAATLRWWSLTGKPLFDAEGRLNGWRGVGSEVTAERLRQEAERQLQASREAAARHAGELDAARRIQIGLLPDLITLQAGESRFSVGAILEPALEVGGDYYECFRLDDRRICFSVADVSGKGVPASLFMAMSKTLAAMLVPRNSDLGAAVREIAREMDRNNPEMLFVTSFIAILDLDNGELSCVSAGHDVPLLLRAGELARLPLGDALGPPICGVVDYPFLSSRSRLSPGDTLYLFTDGVTEATDGCGFFGADRLAQTILDETAGATVHACARTLRDRVRHFESGNPPADDLTVMVLRWHGPAVPGSAPVTECA